MRHEQTYRQAASGQSGTPVIERPLTRRGVIAAGAAIMAGALGALTGRRARAADGDLLELGNTGTPTGPQDATSTTQLSVLPAGTTPIPGLVVMNFFGEAGNFSSATRSFPGIRARGADIGLWAEGSLSATLAVFGSAPGDDSVGVGGLAGGLRGVGVLGSGGAQPGRVGVIGSADNGTGGAFVAGGTATSTIGVFGSARAGAGGSFDSTSGDALRAVSPVRAGFFQGPVLVQGSFTATGMKSAAVPHPDGSLRRLYCLESPQSWFEDFGEGELVAGRAEVKLDADFAAVINSDSYHVFLTPEGDSRGLYVSGKGPAGFEVREQQGGATSLRFSYRVVAGRKDIVGPRLERVTIDPPFRPQLPNMPDLAARARGRTT